MIEREHAGSLALAYETGRSGTGWLSGMAVCVALACFFCLVWLLNVCETG